MIGVLALQGDVEEHCSYLASSGAETGKVKTPGDLAGIEGLVLPGGESTAITKLIRRSGLAEPVRSLIRQGLPVWGTCAGAILLSRSGIWEAADAEVERNAYGSQLASRVKQGQVRGRERPCPMVFIRAPRIVRLSGEAEALAEAEGDIVAARQGKILITTFHPELVPGDRFFLDLFLGLVG